MAEAMAAAPRIAKDVKETILIVVIREKIAEKIR
jgi:hypothetical protein